VAEDGKAVARAVGALAEGLAKNLETLAELLESQQRSLADTVAAHVLRRSHEELLARLRPHFDGLATWSSDAEATRTRLAALTAEIAALRGGSALLGGGSSNSAPATPIAVDAATSLDTAGDAAPAAPSQVSAAGDTQLPDVSPPAAVSTGDSAAAGKKKLLAFQLPSKQRDFGEPQRLEVFELNLAGPATHAKGTISVNAAMLRTGIDSRDEEMRKHLNAAQTPNIQAPCAASAPSTSTGPIIG
jgi:hypothetical protein